MALIESTLPLSNEVVETIAIQLDIGNVIQAETDVYSVQADGYIATLTGRNFRYDDTEHLDSGKIAGLIGTTDGSNDRSVFLSARAVSS